VSIIQLLMRGVYITKKSGLKTTLGRLIELRIKLEIWQFSQVPRRGQLTSLEPALTVSHFKGAVASSLLQCLTIGNASSKEPSVLWMTLLN
jgi:hypothetical protein